MDTYAARYGWTYTEQLEQPLWLMRLLPTVIEVKAENEKLAREEAQRKADRG